MQANQVKRLIDSVRLLGALALLTSAVAWPRLAIPALADDVRDHRDPAARLEVVIRKIQIHDISETPGESEGEFEFNTVLGPIDDGCDARGTSGVIPVWQLHWANCMESELVRGATIKFHAGLGEHSVSHVLPSAGDKATSPAVIGEGFPVMADKVYGFEISGKETDLLSDDNIGSVVFPMLPEKDWGTGVHLIRGIRATEFTDIDSGGNQFGDIPSEFSLEFEVRPAALPDLVASNVGLRRLDDGRDAACMTAGNAGVRPSGDFDVSLKADGDVIPAGTHRWVSLDPGQTRDLCVVDGLPNGRHVLSMDIDLVRDIAESDERNNHYDASVTITAPPPVGIGRPIIGQVPLASDLSNAPVTTDQKDLVIEKTLVVGKMPDSGNDCDPGGNDVLVTIKNQATAATGEFTVRMIVDGHDSDAVDQSVPSLAGGASTEIRFENLKLKKGEHTVGVTADAKNGITETLENNNTSSATVQCKNESD